VIGAAGANECEKSHSFGVIGAAGENECEKSHSSGMVGGCFFLRTIGYITAVWISRIAEAGISDEGAVVRISRIRERF
jgi:hypothetical protein